MTSMRDFRVIQRMGKFGLEKYIIHVNIEEVDVNVGEYVEVDDIIAEVTIDKVLIPIYAEHAGVITKYFAEKGETC